MRGGVLVVACVAAAAACGAYSSTDGPSPTPPPPADGGADVADAGSDAPLACDPARLDTDAKNCGACGHDCLGGACTKGSCQPFVVATSPGDIPIIDVALEDQRIVWYTSTDPGDDVGAHGLYMCPKSGCATPPPNIADDTHQASTIAADGAGNAYVGFPYFGVNGVFRLAPSGTLTQIATHSLVRSAYATPTALYYMGMYEPGDGGFARTIYRYDDAKREQVVCIYQPGDSSNVDNAAYGDDRAYLFAADTSTIASCDLATATVTSYLAANASPFQGMYLGGRLYWVDAEGTLSSCTGGSTCSGPTTELSAAQIDGKALGVASGGGVLYVSSDAGELFSCEPAACPTTKKLIARAGGIGGQTTLYGAGIAADARAVYYAAVEPAPSQPGPHTWQIMGLAR